jgi:hypothetical protein
MSYLSRPRIGFFAQDAMTNPSTANNENVIHLLDYNNVKLVNPPELKEPESRLPHAASRQPHSGPPIPEMSDAAYREWMMTLMTYSEPEDALDDPNQPNWQPALPGYWNYWGDHLTTFGTATVNSLWLDEQPVTAPGSDPLFGARVIFNARIVDLDPADTFTTQFIAAAFKVIGRDADGGPSELISGVPTTSFTRWLNFFRYYGAGTFQSVIPNHKLTFIGDAEAPDSAAFRALRDGARKGGGLLLRYCFYGMRAHQTMLQMYDHFQEGEPAVNPKIGHVLGSIGVWNGRDVASAPVGRLLHQVGPPFFHHTPAGAAAPVSLQVKSHEDVERIATPKTRLHAENADVKCAQSMGPAVALVEDGRVVLDLLTSFPEITCDPNAQGDPFRKHDFGRVQLELTYDAGSEPRSVVLGPVAYDRAAYESRAGVCEIPFAPDSEAGQRIEAGSLQLRDGSGTVLLREIDVVQVVSEDPAVYLDLEKVDGGYRATGLARLRVFRKGKPIEKAVTLRLERYSDVQEAGTANSINPLVVTACKIAEQRQVKGEVRVPPPGELELHLSAEAAGCYKVRLLDPDMEAAYENNPNWAVEYFTTFRVLPFDDYSHIPDDDVTFEFVYREVFSYYAILYPVMSTIIPWGPENTPHDPERVAQFAALINEVVDESRLGTALQMPITRELSAGKRQLLKRWCSRELSTFQA